MRRVGGFLLGAVLGLLAVPSAKFIYMLEFAYDEPECVDGICVGDDLSALNKHFPSYSDLGALHSVSCALAADEAPGGGQSLYTAELVLGERCRTEIRAVIFRTELTHTAMHVRDGRIVRISREGRLDFP